MSQKPVCIQCGGTEYVLESGFYFCVECQAQSQDIHERVFDEYFGGQKSTRLHLAQPPPTTTTQVEKEKKLVTSWETLNIVLRGLVDELMVLGAPEELPVVTLKIWAYYLSKIEVAFLSTSIEVRPRLGLSFNIRDAELVYQAKREMLRAYRKPVSRVKRKARRRKASSSTEHISHRAQKYRLSRGKTALAKAEYDSFSESSQTSGLSLETLGKASSQSDSTVKSYRLRYSRHAEATLTKLLKEAEEVDLETLEKLQTRLVGTEKVSLRHPRMTVLIAVLRLALLITRAEIQLSDLIRWSREGYLSLHNPWRLIPSTVTPGPKKVLSYNSISSWRKVQQMTTRLASLISVFPRSQLLPLCSRFITELSLPNDIFKTIRALLKVCPPKNELNLLFNVEARAMALIVFVLKLAFSLDDTTEYLKSMAICSINRKLGGDLVFEWEAWTCYIEERAAILAKKCNRLRDRLYPGSRVGGAQPFIAQWDMATPTFSSRVDRNLADSISRVMNGLCSDELEPPPAPSLTPLASLASTIPCLRDVSFPLAEFSPLLTVAGCQKLLKKSGLELKIVEGAAVRIRKVGCVRSGKEVRAKRSRIKARVNYQIVSQSSDTDSENESPLVDSDSDYDSRSCSNGDESNEGILYVPACSYRLQEGDFASISLEEFAELELPASTNWLLCLCSDIIEQSPRDLYIQLSLVERVFIYSMSPRFSGSLPQKLAMRW